MARIQTTIRNVRRPGGISAITSGIGVRAADQLDTLVRGTQVSPLDETLGNRYNAFLRTLLNSVNAPATKPLWMCFINDIPNINREVDSLDSTGFGSHQFVKTNKDKIEQTSDFEGGKCALLCQECHIPGETYNTEKQLIGGGFLAPGTGKDRQALGMLKTAYLETNYSLTDAILRPWLIYTSYHSLKYTPRTNITLMKYAKSGIGQPLVPVKILKYHNCCPVEIDEESLTYKDMSLLYRQVSWHYDSYTIEFNHNIKEESRERRGETLASQLLDDFLGQPDSREDNFSRRIASFGENTLNEARGFVANRAGQFIISNSRALGASLEQALGISPNLPNTANGRINQQDTPNVSPRRDDVVIPSNDTPNIFTQPQIEERESFNDVVDTQAARSQNVQINRVIMPENNTPNTEELRVRLRGSRVNIPENDTPNTLQIQSTRVKIPENDTPNNLAN